MLKQTFSATKPYVARLVCVLLSLVIIIYGWIALS